MNFYFAAAKVLDRLDSKQGSIKGVLASIPDKDRKRTSAAVIETLKCKNYYESRAPAVDGVRRDRQAGAHDRYRAIRLTQSRTEEVELSESDLVARPRPSLVKRHSSRRWTDQTGCSEA